MNTDRRLLTIQNMNSKICRTCLNQTATISLFDKKDDVQYCSKLMRCVNVVILEGDGLPDAICVSCAGQLCTLYEFVNKCEASDKKLRCTNFTDLYDNIIPKEEPEIKLEDFKNDFPHDDDHFNNTSYSNEKLPSEHEDIKYLYNTCEDKNLKRKYMEKKKNSEKIDKRKLRSKIGPIKCIVCGYKVSCPSAMQNHMRIHTGEKPYKCHYCDKRFTLKGTQKRHSLRHHAERERKFICETCGNSFYTRSCIITHMRIHTDERPYLCPFCPKAFRQVASMIRHKRLHTGEKPYTCPICFKQFPEKCHMIRHQVVHSDEKNFVCHLCSKSVKTRNALKIHMRVHSNEKHNICSDCGISLSSKGNLVVHMRRKHSEKSGECNVCLKQFADLEAHMRKHTGEKPFICMLCNQAFTNKRSLSNHISFKHNNASKFKCSLSDCKKTFPTTAMLEFHLLKFHTNKTPYICHHCARGFFRSSDLSRHLKMSHMDTKMDTDTTLLISNTVNKSII